MFVRIARSCHRRPWLVITVWIAIVLGGAASAPGLFSDLSSEVGTVPASESSRGRALVRQDAPSGTEIYAVADGRSADDPALRASITRVRTALAALPGVRAVPDPLADGGQSPAVATDGRAVALMVQFEPTEEGWDAVDPAADLLRSIDAPRVVVGGGALQDDEVDSQTAKDVAHAELYSMPVVLLLLVLVFGGIVAAGLPVIVALVGVAATFVSLGALSLVTDVSVYSVNVVTMLGLGLAIDYALLVVSRFRNERAVDPDVAGALERTLASAGRTVAFSGLTVGVSLAGLLVFSDTFLRSMGFAGMSVVLLDLLAALTLLPALLSLVGHRIHPSRPRPDGRGLFVTVARAVRRRPVAVLLVVGIGLSAAALPFADAQWADADARSLPRSSPSRQLSDLATERFAAAADVEAVTSVLCGPITSAQLTAYVDRLRALPGARTVAVRKTDPEMVVDKATGQPITIVDVTPTGTSQDDVAQDLVRSVRTTAAPVPHLVTGDAAWLVDYQDMLRHRLPYAFGIVLLATFALLFLFTGSIVIPLKAVLTNLLSLGTSLGALVWVFQQGHLGWMVGTEALGTLSITTPVLLFAIAFGLSMDYEVFLLGRICEEWRRSGDNDLAVERGLQHTGRIVTTAAALMVIVFAGFVAGGFSPIKQLGLGLVLAVLVDATLVRMLLVPAVMTLMGRLNWWAPPALRRLHDRIGLRETPVVPSASAETEAYVESTAR